MEAVNSNIDFYYFDVFLTETYKGLGQYEEITKPDIIGQLTSITLSDSVSGLRGYTPPPELELITITGITKSRLDEVKTYSLFNSKPIYKLNVNGVFNITNEFIEYSIDNIRYKTYLSDGLTTYSITKPKETFENRPVIWNADSVFIDIKKTLNAMVIDRGNISVYDYFNKINNCDELDDLLEIF
jgi:hypothetical protein